MLDPSEIDRIVEVTKVPIGQLVDWKNRLGEPFRLKCEPLDGGLYRATVDLGVPFHATNVLPVVHGEFEKHDDADTKAVTYEARPGNTMGQLVGNDGQPAFGVAFDLTSVDAEGRPLLKVYFGSAAAWFVKNEYHAKWNAVREVRAELEPGLRKAPEPAPVTKAAAQNPRSRQRERERHRGRGRGRR